MKVKVTTETVLNLSLTLSREEAEYLRGLIQNVDPAEEPTHLQEFRRELFNSLKPTDIL
ncbi:hypothetical protein PssvBMR4_gp14 [Pseudomonas phage MR4]|uniref:Uncharacterized protein n=1 Tax=Pseudomonas phage MR4 TaxID=2711171 RepID=A0A6M3TC99_9CAUD|nr:hypothetical protein PssvBMR4_gp14 [Pseudomonas phage MR4]